MKKFVKLLCILFLIVFGANVFADPIDVKFDDGVYVVKLDGQKLRKKIHFVASEKLVTNKEMHQKANSVLTINTGFFDPKNQKTISYIVNDRVIIEDPLFNENVMYNPILRQNLDKILNRSEFRVIECDNKYSYEIVPHKTGVDFGCFVVTSAQGGPQLLPDLTLEEEFFIVKNADGKIVRESASVLHKTARTLIGLKDGNVYLIIATNEHPMTIYEARDYCKSLGLERAMAFDGGSSTSFNYKDKINVTSTGIKTDDTGRALKSFLIIN